MPIPSHSSFVNLLLARNLFPPTNYIRSFVPNSACARSCGSAIIDSVTVQELDADYKSVDMHKHTSHESPTAGGWACTTSKLRQRHVRCESLLRARLPSSG